MILVVCTTIDDLQTRCIFVCTGVPGVLAALVLAFLSNLFGSITHYGSGQVRPRSALS